MSITDFPAPRPKIIRSHQDKPSLFLDHHVATAGETYDQLVETAKHLNAVFPNFCFKVLR